MKKFNVILRLLAGMLLLGLASCTSIDAVTGEKVYNLYSMQSEINLGVQTIQANTEEMKKQGCRINDDSKQMAKLNEIKNRITAVADMPQLPYEVTLYHTNIVNAAAAPGGQMFVFEGLYEGKEALCRDDDELAAVMAHEIAHVNCRHSTERLSKITTAALVFEVGAIALESNDESGWATGLRAMFAVGTVIWVPMHSKKDEFEADRVGLFYMAKAGYDPRAAPRIWRRVAEEDPDQKDKASIFATHPSAGDRCDALEAMMPYAMQEYARATGSYPKDYKPEDAGLPEFDWRRPGAKK
ncbi:MAG: M48 family metallopeptidase [Kiritimatiellia bacterium]